jgi:hypothetical protein
MEQGLWNIMWNIVGGLVVAFLIFSSVAVSTGGGNFILGVEEGDGAPMAGISCYLFAVDGAYLCPLNVPARWTYRWTSRGRPMKSKT